MNFVPSLLFVIPFLIAGSSVDATSCGAVPIQQWDSRPVRYMVDLRKPVELVVVTHTVTQECYTDAACKRIARAIRRNHIDQGMTDIGLSFLIGGNGEVYEGAGWKVGTHTQGYNDKSISLSFIGDFREKLPTKQALETAQNFLGCAVSVRYLGRDYSLVGHRQLRATISPGDALQRHIETWQHWTYDISAL